jgi:uncharacterized cupredoxin-like copper-binding protein
MIKTYRLRATVMVALTLGACASKVDTPITLAPAGVDWREARVEAVSMEDFEFTPAHPVFKAGQPVRLVLVDAGTGHHNFSAPAFFASALYRPGSTLPTGGQITLGSGEKAEIDLIPQTPGDYAVECTIFLHAMMGMTGAITVTK